MANVELIMPKMGESVNEATVIRWLKKEGDQVAMDEPVLEIATDKVDSEIPSTAAGTLIRQLFKEGEVVQVGKAVAIIGSGSAETIPVTPRVQTTPAVTQKAETVQVAAEKSAPVLSSTGNRFYSPLVRTIAQKEGISAEELETIPGTGKDGRVTKQDILAFLPQRGKKVQTREQSSGSNGAEQSGKTVLQTHKAPAVISMAGDEIIEMDRMRKLIAEHMVMSKHVAPHVTSFVEADVTNLVLWRERVKKEFEKKEGEKITYTPVFIDAVCKAIRDFPMVNISVDGTKLIVRKNINIGMATALPSGNLIVPVIRNADRMNLFGLTKAVNDLAGRARANKLLPDEIQGGTYTITNVGTFGNVMGTPIINQPQVAILAIGTIKKKPVVIESPSGDTIGIRHMMFLSHSYDHRVVDGALGGQFVRRVADYLERFDPNTLL
ncbi:MAG: 2-oxo acid dehydrogenase subunit E2 [Bacteroidia bacterium]|nr:2-oxo acid dehydrogenase subunit E2 [Bacteroidia bacterium]